MRNERSKSALLLALALVVCMVIPFLFWHQAWFGRVLDDTQLTQYLMDNQKSRRIQHALTQVAERIEQRDPKVKQWYETVAGLAAHPFPQIRIAAAWVMGQDPSSELFHSSLLQMLEDAQPLIRRNVALSLVRFGDAAGLKELRAMLQPYRAKSPAAGGVHFLVDEGEWVEEGTPLLRLVKNGDRNEITAILPGQVLSKPVSEGSPVSIGDCVLTLSPNPEHVWESLRALYLVGGADELRLIDSIAQNPFFSVDIRKQAILTAEAIQQRIYKEPESRIQNSEFRIQK